MQCIFALVDAQSLLGQSIRISMHLFCSELLLCWAERFQNLFSSHRLMFCLSWNEKLPQTWVIKPKRVCHCWVGHNGKCMADAAATSQQKWTEEQNLSVFSACILACVLKAIGLSVALKFVALLRRQLSKTFYRKLKQVWLHNFSLEIWLGLGAIFFKFWAPNEWSEFMVFFLVEKWNDLSSEPSPINKLWVVYFGGIILRRTNNWN